MSHSNKKSLFVVALVVIHFALMNISWASDIRKAELEEEDALHEQEGKNQDYKITTYEIEYGSGKEQVGAEFGGDGVLWGPQSFNVDDKGNVYICDTLIKRIQIYSSDGNHLKTIRLEKDVIASDIVLDDKGFIYIYDDFSITLYQYDLNGNRIASIPVKDSRFSVIGQINIIGNKIYVRSSGPSDVLVGKIVGNKLSRPTLEELKQPLEEKIYSPSGRNYVLDLVPHFKGTVEIREKDGTVIDKIAITPKGIIGIEYLGEDASANLYINTTRNEDSKLISEIYVFDMNGTLLQTVILNDVTTNWAARNYAVDKHGHIYQFLTKDKQVKLSIIDMKN